MTTTDASRGRTAGFNERSARERDHGAVGRACQASDMKSLLQQIAGQMEQSERRQTAAILDVKTRIENLQLATASAREHLPTEAALKLDQAEASLAMLAGQVAAAGRDRAMHRAAAVADLPQEPVPAPALAPTEPAAAIAAAPAAAMAIDPDNPWTIADAETLAAIFDPSTPPPAAVKPPAAPAQAEVLSDKVIAALIDPDLAAEMDDAPPEPIGILDESAGASFDAGLAAHDRGWLEQRLATMADDLRSTIATAQPEQSLRAMGERIGKLEQQLTKSISSLATRGDLDALGTIDTQLADLSQQFERTSQQMTRLDVLEHQVRAIAGRLSDERFEKLTHAARPGTGEIDTMASRIAELVGSTLALRMPKSVAGGDQDQTRELHGMLATLMAEHRQSDEQTAHVLDTMQQALIGLLDRMDALETVPAPAADRIQAHSQPAPAADRIQAHSQPAQAFEDEIDDQTQFAPRNPTRDARPARAYTPEVEPQFERQPVAQPDPAPVASAALPEAPLAPAAMPAPHAVPLAAIEPIRAAVAAPKSATRAAAGEPDLDDVRPAGRQPQLENRDEFIAAARRAIRQSRIQQANAEEKAAAGPDAQEAPLPQARAGVLAGAAAKRPKIDSRILVAMLAVIVVGAGYQLGIKPLLTKAPVAAQLAPEAPVGVKRADTVVARPQIASEPKARTTEGLTIEPITPAPSIPKSPDPQPKRPAAMVPTEAQPDAPVVQGPRPSLRPVPETMVDELSHRPAPTEPPAENQRDARAPQQPGSIIPLGIFVQHTGSLPTPQDLQRIQDRQTLAQLSGQLGAAQRRPIAGMQPMPLPQLTPPAAVRAEPIALTAPAAVTQGQVIDAPQAKIFSAQPRQPVADALPASVGPMSLRMAAQAGDPSAEFEVATRLAEGKGVQQDLALAALWYQRAADRGFGIAQYRLASMYERGLGVPADKQRAAAWYQQAASSGHIKAMHNLGVIVAAGATQADYLDAAKWFQKAGQHGLADSQFNLAVMYESGLGVERDLAQAYRWLSLAALAGDAQAVKRLEKIKKLLAPEEMTAIDLETARWRPMIADRSVNDPHNAGQAWKTRQAARPTH